MQSIALSTTEGAFSNNLKCIQCGKYFKTNIKSGRFKYLENGQFICLEKCPECERITNEHTITDL